MAISYLRPAYGQERAATRLHRRLTASGRRRPRGPGTYALVGLALVLAGVIVVGVLTVTSSPAITSDSSALAKITMPFGGGHVQSVAATGPREQQIPVTIRGGRIWPTKLVPVHELVSIDVVVKRPGWDGWLAGSSDRIHASVMTPSVRLRNHYITLAGHAPLTLHFSHPVAALAYGATTGHLRRHILSTPQSDITLPRAAPAGTLAVSAAPRTWESASPTIVSWFPAGAGASAVANPAPGGQIGPSTPITITFSKPSSEVLHSSLPPNPAGAAGAWTRINSHSITFRPTGYGYGLGAHVTVALPGGVRLVGGSGSTGSWTVPGGSPLRLQQLLAMLGYLPLDFHYTGARPASTPAGEEAAAIHPPKGSFVWRWHDIPGALRTMWQPGASGVITRGALMKFEDDHGMTADGVAGPAVWKALITAAFAHKGSSFGYTFVMVSEGSPESIDVWHSGRTVVTGPVNTGIPQAPTAQGVFPVFEHLPSTTMSGTNPDGSHYSDPGVPWVSYFNGGDALHGFLRASYGTAQSLGCVEMPYAQAAKVYPYTPIGTLVDVS